mmetsp:Transcript_14154/g.39007  ORF Transcript_14154/g.39007 Transcript_14154/m.39007 type:complete len:327 (-) Transcript_14154:325-1305(-)
MHKIGSQSKFTVLFLAAPFRMLMITSTTAPTQLTTMIVTHIQKVLVLILCQSRSRLDVWWKVRILIVDKSPPIHEAVWLKVNEDIGIISADQREWSPMNNRTGFVQDHVTRLHGDVDCLAIMTVDLYGPILIHILRHIDDRRRDEWDAVAVRTEHRTLVVHAHAIDTGGTLLHAGPFLDGGFGGVPDGIGQFGPGALQFFVFDTNKVRRYRPMVGVNVSRVPHLFFAVVLVDLPKVPNQFHNVVGCADLDESSFGEVPHRNRLTVVHVKPFSFVGIADVSKLVAASLHVVLIEAGLVSQILFAVIEVVLGKDGERAIKGVAVVVGG